MADESTLLTGGKRSSRLGVLRVLCNEDKQLWFHPHELLETLGFGRANLARTLKRWAKTHGFGGDEEQPFASARLESIKVGDKTLLCLNKSGMHAILILLYDKPAALAVVTNRTVSKVARQLLSVDLGAEEEEEDDEEEEEAAAATEEESSAASSSSEEEADAAGLERVSFRSQRPSPPDCEALGELALYLRMVLERLLRRLRTESKLKEDSPSALVADTARRYLTVQQFWNICIEVAPAIEGLKAPQGTRKRRLVEVGVSGGLFLQLFRMRTGLLRAADLRRAMRLGRTSLEQELSLISRKHVGTPSDMAQYALSHAASKSVIEMLSQGTGSLTSYSNAIEKQSWNAIQAVTSFFEHQTELSSTEVYVYAGDNYYVSVTCVPSI
jgi:hypothetical protein